MTSSEGEDAPLDDISLRTLEEIREIHNLDEDWEPRFAADTPRAEEKAAEYRQLGFEAEVYPHPDDVATNQLPARNDRCVVYTRDTDDDDGGMIDDSLL
jgi:hypothetical protein